MIWIWKYWVLWLAYQLLGRLSLQTLYGIANFVGTGAYLARAKARRGVIANMRQVMGPETPERAVRRAALEVFRNATRYYADLLSVPRMDVRRFRKEQLDIEGEEYLDDAQRSGRGGVLVSAHFGSPELAVQGLAADGYVVFGLTEPLRPKQLSDFIHGLRSRHGHVYRTVGFGGIKEALRRLKAGGLVAILLDRDVGGTGVPMEFCGAMTKIPVGAIDLALRTGSDLIPAWAWRISGFRFRVRIGPPLEIVRTGDFDQDVLTNARRLLALFEGHLRAYPGQWAVLEPIWEQQDGKRPAVR
ncbi:MAG: lysophospholipid acyltransferase family protein [Chloroflexi bacterium]|nr:lysophospholipid acyltransferase family protein [Chloroflexota bacterium]